MIERIQVIALLSVLPITMLGGAFVIGAIDSWSLWRAIVGLSFLIIAGICFALALIIDRVKGE